MQHLAAPFRKSFMLVYAAFPALGDIKVCFTLEGDPIHLTIGFFAPMALEMIAE